MTEADHVEIPEEDEPAPGTSTDEARKNAKNLQPDGIDDGSRPLSTKVPK